MYSVGSGSFSRLPDDSLSSARSDSEDSDSFRSPLAAQTESNSDSVPISPSEWTSHPLNLRLSRLRPDKRFGVPVVTVRELSKLYQIDGRQEKVTALKRINLTLDDRNGIYPILEGEFVMIRGPSGGGKTTLLNLLGSLDFPSSGSIEILGEKVSTSSPDAYLADLRLRKIGFVFQTFNLLATMSAFENVELPMTIRGKLNAKERRARAVELLTKVGLKDRMGHLPSELSGGEQQRVTIARALANECKILLLDGKVKIHSSTLHHSYVLHSMFESIL